MLLGVIMDCAIAFVFFERRTVASIFDVNHSVGDRFSSMERHRPHLLPDYCLDWCL
jgi:hypothetical protein